MESFTARKDSRTNQKAKVLKFFTRFGNEQENTDYLAMRSAHKEKYENGIQLYKKGEIIVGDLKLLMMLKEIQK